MVDEVEEMQYCTPADIIIDNIPVNLWGRVVLHDMGAVLTTQPVQRMIILPYDQEQVSNLIRTFDDWSIFHVPLLVILITIILKIKLVSFFKLHTVIFPSIVNKTAFK